MKDEVLDLVGMFTWSYGNQFFVETSQGNYIWKDPDYQGGDNTFTKTDMTYKEWTRKIGIPFGRDKGHHVIRNYCGEDIIIK